MSIYAISDLHLAFGVEKPMDVFGPRWHRYMERIEENWRAIIKTNDTVLIPGDVSWAMNLKEFSKDILFIESLPGKKIITRGNHDYWWESSSKLKKFAAEQQLDSTIFLYNNAFKVEDRIVCGTRGWRSPSEDGFTSEDQKIHLRELIRFELSLSEARKLKADSESQIIALLHYPPLDALGKDHGYFDLMQKFGVSTCLYGHMHGENCSRAFEGELDDMELKLVSADHLEFKPFLII
ncbi:MAG: metallophosphoesterase [Bacillota bacterium]